MTMTGEELRTIRKGLGLSCAELGRWLLLASADPGWSVRMWENGSKPIAGPTEMAVRAFAWGYRPPHVGSPVVPRAGAPPG